MRIIISGGTGSIGHPLANLLHEEGNDVFVLSRNPQKHTVNNNIQLIQWDSKTAQGWGHLINKDTALINLAGENPAASSWTDEHKQQVLTSRLNAASAMVEAVTKANEKPAVLLQASAVGYYGDMGASILTEDNAAGNNWRAQVCVDWEATVQSVPAQGIRTCILRIGIVLDKDNGALPSFIQAAKLMGRQLGDGQQWIPWVHNDDIAHMIRFLMLKESASGAYNLTAPQPATNSHFMQTLAEVINRPALVPVPAFALKLALGEMATTVLDSQRVIPQRLIDAGYDFQFPNLKTALHNLLK